MPERAYKKGIPMWNLQKTCDGNEFSRSVRQELDVYDLDLLKYMRTSARGIRRPSTLGGTMNSNKALTTQGGATIKEAMGTLRSSM